MKNLRVRVEENYSPRFWSQLDAIAGVFCLVAFLLMIAALNLSAGMEQGFSQAATNYDTGEVFLVLAAVITIITFILLMSGLILMATSTYYIQEEERQLLYILGYVKLVEEDLEKPRPIQLIQPTLPSKSQKFGTEEEGKWTYNGSRKTKMFGNDQQGKWSYGQFKKLDQSQV